MAEGRVFSSRTTRNRSHHASAMLTAICLVTLVVMYNRMRGTPSMRQQGMHGQTDKMATWKQTQWKTPITICTESQLDVIRYQLPPDDCVKNADKPLNHQCSHSWATRCPDPIWLTNYYQKDKRTADSFFAVYVGCNKGIDAVNTMRMGSANPVFDKELWTSTFFSQVDPKERQSGSCRQGDSPQYSIPEDTTILPAQLHCIEPMPRTVAELKRSAIELGWNKQGFVVTQAAMSNEDSTTLVPVNNTVGVENKGMNHWDIDCGSETTTGQECQPLHTYKLDTYMQKYAKETKGPIQMLSVDVEGFDFDVLLGASQTLRRTQYLEFEYHSKGKWIEQSLADAIALLDSSGFVCYWAGNKGNIWRINGCWLDQYSIHKWANVACVNHNMMEAKELADRMEQQFLDTLARNQTVRYDHM